MRTAILLACMAAWPAGSYGADDPKPAARTAQEQKAPPAAAATKATTPKAPPAADSSKPPAAQPEGSDPTRMAAPAPDPNTQPPGAPNEHTYLIGPEDVLHILVWGNAMLTAPAMVRSDGKITVGLIGEVAAAGETPEKLSKEIADRLKAGGYLLNPKVTVSVQQINSKNFFIQGEVNKPGRYSLIVPMTVLEALVNAGGFRDFANKKDIRIIRGDKQFKFNYNQVIKGKNRDQNIYLMPGDLIVVN
jgi:polysaccharide export outer membrane protein